MVTHLQDKQEVSSTDQSYMVMVERWQLMIIKKDSLERKEAKKEKRSKRKHNIATAEVED